MNRAPLPVTGYVVKDATGQALAYCLCPRDEGAGGYGEGFDGGPSAQDRAQYRQTTTTAVRQGAVR